MDVTQATKDYLDNLVSHGNEKDLNNELLDHAHDCVYAIGLLKAYIKKESPDTTLTFARLNRILLGAGV